MPPDPTQNSARRLRQLRCTICGRSDEASAAELLRFTRTGWPKCCGQVMGLVTEDGPPTPLPPKRPTS
jgi:hypothetical protein